MVARAVRSASVMLVEPEPPRMSDSVVVLSVATLRLSVESTVEQRDLRPVVPVDVQPAGYLAGWYSAGLARMYISRGIGTTRIALRLGCRPEVPVFRLACA